MTDFRTKLSVGKSKLKIDLHDPIFCMGSCFAETIGSRLTENKFNTLINPFGIIFNPVSIFKLIDLTLNKEQPEEESYIERDGTYFNYLSHSEINAESQEELAKKIKNIQHEIFTF